jgi:predicted amidohydrolase YtcJ
MRKAFLCLFLLWVLVVRAIAQETGGDCVIENVRIPQADGTYAEPGRVTIKAGMIAAVEPGKTDPPVDRGTSTIDGQAGFLIGGLVDAHCHIKIPGVDLSRLAEEGVTHVIDLAADASVAEAAAKMPGRVSLVGPLITAKGGHGTEFGLETLQIPLDADDQAVRELVQGGAKPKWALAPVGLKIVYDHLGKDGGPGTEGAYPALKKTQLATIFDEAVKMGIRRIHVHVGGDEAWTTDVLECAAAVPKADAELRVVLEHSSGQGLTADRLAAARASKVQVVVVPTTVGVLFHIGQAAPNAPLDKILESLSAGIKSLGGTDVPIFVGTDTGKAGDLKKELYTLATALAGSTQDRATNLRLLKAATRPHQPATDLVVSGGPGDLLVLRQDPIADLTALNNVVRVVVGGKLLAPGQ